jgi:DAK2 domain fusion protein YloV
VTETNLERFRAAVAGALAHLESRRQEINDLNVFPVADGDTGDNMALTLRAVLEELDRLSEGGARTVDDIGREEIVHSVARAALLGARGNSGVILSQLIRGAAEELVSRPGELIDPTLIGAALARAADRAYTSVRTPAEGTILTVAREMAHQIVTDVAHQPDPRLGPETPAGEQDEVIAATLARALQAGEQSVKRGPDLLFALRDAGVVDAGGHGLTVIFAGVVAALRGEEPPPLERHQPPRITHPHHHSSTYRFCTNFAVTGRGLHAADFVAGLEAIGDSVLVVGDEETLKIHLHTDEPERATTLFGGVGEVSRLDVADMHEQVAQRDGRLGARRVRCGALAVVSGVGVRGLFESLGVHCLDGGPTLNPSTYELLAGIHAVPAEQVVVLPNSPNVIMAAERAAELSEKTVQVIPVTSQQSALAAAVAFDSERSVEENALAITDALVRVRSGSLAPAARDDAEGRFRTGEAVGFVADQLRCWGDPRETLRCLLQELGSGAELLTCLAGEHSPLDEDEVRSLAPENVELEWAVGGQPGYWYLVAAE